MIYHISWSQGGGYYSRAFETREERAAFRKLLNEKWNISEWENKKEV